MPSGVVRGLVFIFYKEIEGEGSWMIDGLGESQ